MNLDPCLDDLVNVTDPKNVIEKTIAVIFAIRALICFHSRCFSFDTSVS